MLIASQIFWIRCILDLGERFIPGKPRRAWLAVVASLLYLIFLAFRFLNSGIGHIPRSAGPQLRSFLIVGAFSWWLVGSWMGFGLMIAFWTADQVARSAVWAYRKARAAAGSHVAAPGPRPALALPAPLPQANGHCP
jgi:hypothetical protein